MMNKEMTSSVSPVVTEAVDKAFNEWHAEQSSIAMTGSINPVHLMAALLRVWHNREISDADRWILNEYRPCDAIVKAFKDTEWAEVQRRLE